MNLSEVLNRKELVILSQALEVRQATLRSTILCHPEDQRQNMMEQMKQSAELSRKVQRAIRDYKGRA